ncbi:MAG TPA: 7-carboxy-7-deazaguanine synthase QueE [Crenalkalicoccus sp.]|jgi:7-carboxy-7-deazaguanine synthase|nr:7-carboxy-7-deazaguanine synthase QueE [Crenalkalicoccus sp.]
MRFGLSGRAMARPAASGGPAGPYHDVIGGAEAAGAAPRTVLPLAEIFETIQGEATHAGTPAVFIRLQGCAVGCPWCDTKETWALDPADEVPLAVVLAKDGAAKSPRHARAEVAELAAIARGFRSRLVVITGGEPAIHDLRPLSAALLEAGKRVQLETSGTEPIRIDPRAWVTVSPKIGMPGGFTVRPDALHRADEIKMPVGRARDVERLGALLAEHAIAPEVPVWLQPLSRSAKATALCVAAATEHGWRVSIQVHAFIGVR